MSDDIAKAAIVGFNMLDKIMALSRQKAEFANLSELRGKEITTLAESLLQERLAKDRLAATVAEYEIQEIPRLRLALSEARDRNEKLSAANINLSAENVKLKRKVSRAEGKFKRAQEALRIRSDEDSR